MWTAPTAHKISAKTPGLFLLKAACFTCSTLKQTPKPGCTFGALWCSTSSKLPWQQSCRCCQRKGWVTQSKARQGGTALGQLSLAHSSSCTTRNRGKEKFNPVELFNRDQITKWHMQHYINVIVGKKEKFFLSFKPLWQKLIWNNSSSFSQWIPASVRT